MGEGGGFGNDVRGIGFGGIRDYCGRFDRFERLVVYGAKLIHLPFFPSKYQLQETRLHDLTAEWDWKK